MGYPKFAPKTAHSPSTIYNYPHLIHLPSTDGPLTVQNGIWIQSAIFPQYTLRTDRPTDRWSRRMFSNMSAPLAMLTDSDALKPNFCARCTWLSPLPAPLILCYVLLVLFRELHRDGSHPHPQPTPRQDPTAALQFCG